MTIIVRKDGTTREQTKPILEDRFDVRHLYRFRIMAGPVYSSLKIRDRNFSVVNDTNGRSIISSSADGSHPVNYPVFLKVYLFGEQDILKPPQCVRSIRSLDFDWKGCFQRLSPIIGINLVDNPLEHFYTGASFEITRGLDVVSGVEWSKVHRLAGGFVNGQDVTGTGMGNPPTSHRFEAGYFVGVTVDLGILGTWLNNTIGQGLSALFPSRPGADIDK